MTVTMLLVPLLFSQPQDQPQGTTAQANKAATDIENAVPEDVQIIASDYKFSPSEFTVKPGRKVRITLLNQGKKAHNIQFDLPGGKKEKIPRDVGPGQTGAMEFTVAGPGTFTYICPVDFHATLGMKGKMIVK